MLWFADPFNYADRQAIFSLFPLPEAQLHLSAIQLGPLGSSFALVYGISGPLSTACAGRRPFWAVSTRGALYAWQPRWHAASRSCCSFALRRDWARPSISPPPFR